MSCRSDCRSISLWWFKIPKNPLHHHGFGETFTRVKTLSVFFLNLYFINYIATNFLKKIQISFTIFSCPNRHWMKGKSLLYSFCSFIEQNGNITPQRPNSSFYLIHSGNGIWSTGIFQFFFLSSFLILRTKCLNFCPWVASYSLFISQNGDSLCDIQLRHDIVVKYLKINWQQAARNLNLFRLTCHSFARYRLLIKISFLIYLILILMYNLQLKLKNSRFELLLISIFNWFWFDSLRHFFILMSWS